MKKEITYPAEITFKAFFYRRPELREEILVVLGEGAIDPSVTLRASRNGTFISFTITARFESEECLNETCTRVSRISGFVMMI